MGNKKKKKQLQELDPPAGAPGRVVLWKYGRGFTQPDVWLVDADGDARVWKRWTRRSAIERWLIDARLARREAAILRKLSDLEGFPRFISHPDPWTIEMTLLDAEPVPEKKGSEHLNDTYFARLEEMLATMHARGVNHGDLRRRNMLRAPGDPSTPRMVDFTQCLNFTPPLTGLRGIIFREAIKIDRVTLLKLKRWYLGDDALTEEELAEAERRPWHLKLGRALRKGVYRPFKHWRQGKSRKKKSHSNNTAKETQ